jgi:hypothetical protein
VIEFLNEIALDFFVEMGWAEPPQKAKGEWWMSTFRSFHFFDIFVI